MCFRFPFSDALENRKKQAAVFVIGRNRLSCCSVSLKPLLASRVSTAGRKSVLLCREVSSGSDILLTGIFVGSDRKAEIFFFFGYGRPSKVGDGIAHQRQMCGSSRRRRHTGNTKRRAWRNTTSEISCIFSPQRSPSQHAQLRNFSDVISVLPLCWRVVCVSKGQEHVTEKNFK